MCWCSQTSESQPGVFSEGAVGCAARGALTVAHALQEVLESLCQLAGLGREHRAKWEWGLIPVTGKGRSRAKSLTWVTWGSPPESAIWKGDKG